MNVRYLGVSCEVVNSRFVIIDKKKFVYEIIANTLITILEYKLSSQP